MIQGFRDLEVYQRAYRTSLDIHKLSMNFPKTEQYELGAQVRRATKSIAMNIAEGFGKRGSVSEFKRYLHIALGSCAEVHVQLDYCRDLEYINAEQYELYRREYNVIGKQLITMIRKWQ